MLYHFKTRPEVECEQVLSEVFKTNGTGRYDHTIVRRYCYFKMTPFYAKALTFNKATLILVLVVAFAALSIMEGAEARKVSGYSKAEHRRRLQEIHRREGCKQGFIKNGKGKCVPDAPVRPQATNKPFPSFFPNHNNRFNVDQGNNRRVLRNQHQPHWRRAPTLAEKINMFKRQILSGR
ncbi:unnamed protein product [Allacma fusca]|uniref:Uncharacterized protein n=1 Tax=Allacma fusca TaxID=39272 RepID=A0A8J2LLD5_9HEXA|nr:unnamed protein product [Allacma fusca]